MEVGNMRAYIRTCIIILAIGLSLTFSSVGFATLDESSHWPVEVTKYWNALYGTISGLTLEAGDSIGAFDADGNCYGAGLFDGTYYSLSAFMKEEATDGLDFAIDGFEEGEEVIFKVYKESAGEIYTLEASNGTPYIYAYDGGGYPGYPPMQIDLAYTQDGDDGSGDGDGGSGTGDGDDSGDGDTGDSGDSGDNVFSTSGLASLGDSGSDDGSGEGSGESSSITEKEIFPSKKEVIKEIYTELSEEEVEPEDYDGDMPFSRGRVQRSASMDEDSPASRSHSGATERTPKKVKDAVKKPAPKPIELAPLGEMPAPAKAVSILGLIALLVVAAKKFHIF